MAGSRKVTSSESLIGRLFNSFIFLFLFSWYHLLLRRLSRWFKRNIVCRSSGWRIKTLGANSVRFIDGRRKWGYCYEFDTLSVQIFARIYFAKQTRYGILNKSHWNEWKFYEKKKSCISRGFIFANLDKIHEIRENISSRKFVHFKVLNFSKPRLICVGYLKKERSFRCTICSNTSKKILLLVIVSSFYKMCSYEKRVNNSVFDSVPV